MEDFLVKFRIDELKIAQIGPWVISLRPAQVTLASLVLSLDRPCARMADLTKGEGESLVQAYQKIDKILDAAFRPDKINYLALMMVDHQVHFHVVPRYEKERDFEKKRYVDKDWPRPPQVLAGIHFGEVELLVLKDYLQQFA